MYAMTGILACGLVANYALGPVPKAYYLPLEGEQEGGQEGGRESEEAKASKT